MQSSGNPFLPSTTHLTTHLTTHAVRHARRRSALVAVLALGTFGVLGACGSDNDSTSDGGGDSATDETGDESVDETADESAEEPTDTADADEASDAGAADTPTAGDVAACLDEAGYATVTNEEQLSEQQRADLETAFGQVDGLTFDATTTEFAGGILFFANADQVQDRADAFADVALELRPVGTALISVEAGSNYDEAVAAAEACLG